MTEKEGCFSDMNHTPPDTRRGYGRQPVEVEYWAPWVDDFEEALYVLELEYEIEEALKAERREREEYLSGGNP